jgi:myo-inositol-1(or 4)-monophosphatase
MSITDGELAVAAALAGADVVKRLYGRPLGRVVKSPKDFATEADIEAEKAILGVLREARPQDAIVGEESGRSGPVGTDREWLVDPLCGTLNYAARTPLVAVNVALRGGDARVAAAADPFAGEVFWTDGDGAYLRHDGVDELLTPSAQSMLVDVNLDDPSPNAPAFRAALLLADEGFARQFHPRVASTTLALTWVAAGRRAAYVTDGHLDNEHFAPGIALCQAAGCVVTDLRGEPVHTGLGGLIAAADAETHATLLDLVAGQLRRAA